MILFLIPWYFSVNYQGIKEQYYRPVCVSSCFFSFSVVPDLVIFIENLLVYVTVSAKTYHLSYFSHTVILVPSCSSTFGTPHGAVRFALSHTVSKLHTSLCWHRVHVTRWKQAFLLDRRYTQCKPYTMSGHAITSFLQVLHGSCFLTRRRVGQ